MNQAGVFSGAQKTGRFLTRRPVLALEGVKVLLGTVRYNMTGIGKL